MALNLKALTKNMLSKRTFDHVSYYGTLCGQVETNHRLIVIPGRNSTEYIKVVKQYYYYLNKLWSFTIVNEHDNPSYRWGDVIKAGWKTVEDK